jgi:hypothetical protein
VNILKNAIDSIVLGVEDYGSSDPKRLISATRNLVAGILLLIKHKLVELSPAGSNDALIKQRVLPELDGKGGVIWKGDGQKTVDVQQMRERCTSLGINVDWKRVEKIVVYRNEVEHYFPSLSHAALRTLVADSFIIIRDFLRAELDEDPLIALGAPTWTSLMGVADVYNKERHECEANLQSVDWTYSTVLGALEDWHCPVCGSGLIDVTNPGAAKWTAVLKCRACGKEYDFETAVEDAINDFYQVENHLSIKDGGEPVTISCPNCSHDTYHLEEDCCLICEESAERKCQRCGMDIPASEIDGSGYCSWCNHMMAKDD